MPFKNPQDRKKWREENREKHTLYMRVWRTLNPENVVAERQRRYVKKRCPSCNKQIVPRKDYPSTICQHCGTKIKISKTLSANPNSDNAHGIRLKVV